MPSVDDLVLYEVFHKYCNFGSRAGSLAGESPSGRKASSVTTPLLDGARFAKLAREANLLDEAITSTEVDILFSKVKDRGERRISFLQFRMALKLLAEKKYGTDTDDAEERALTAVRNVTGPQLSGTTMPEASNTLDRLMEGSATYISKSPNTEGRAWKDDLRRNSSPTSRRTSNSVTTPGTSRKSSLNPAQLSSMQQQDSPSKSSNLAL